jgi:kumamolisin
MNILFLLALATFTVSAEALFQPKIINHGSYKALNHTKNLSALFGHVPPDVADATEVRPMDEDAVLTLLIVLPLNNEEELDQLLVDLTNPNSIHYQNYLTQDEFLHRYAPNVAQVDSAVSILSGYGFTFISSEPNRLFFRVSATVRAINQAFNTEIHYFIDDQGQEFYAPAYELQVDSALTIKSVLGLENRIKAQNHAKRLKQPSDHDTKEIRGLTPALIKNAYGISSNLNGSGQTLALFELDGFSISDITTYEQAFGLPNVPLEVVLLDGATGIPGPGADEVTLDIELMIALAPSVTKIMVYEGPNSSKGLVDTYNKIATDNLAKSISTSWGLSETDSFTSLLQAENSIFKQMTLQGQVLFAASGDSGAFDNGRTLSVDDPSSQPFVVGVGGSTLSTDGLGNYVSETAWSGSGGGISAVWSLPSWQQGFANSSNLGSNTKRNVPDVAIDADPNTGFAIYFNGGWFIYGGTSCGAPLWAAFTALVNQSRASSSLPPIGFINPTIYQVGAGSSYLSLFHDITSGNNNHYRAVAGYDLATGLGSFRGDALISYLQNNNQPLPCIRANPTVQISPSSQQGSKGSTLSYTVFVTNNDSLTCSSSSFRLTKTMPSGFTSVLQNSTLVITPNQTVPTSLSVRSSSTSTAGNHSFQVAATNTQNSVLKGSASGTYVVLRR